MAMPAASSHMTITLYGIPNCDTVKRARAWLDGHGVAHAFHDFKKAGVPPARLVEAPDLERLQDLVAHRAGIAGDQELEAAPGL